MTITADEVRRILFYDPNTGIFIWRNRADAGRNWNSKHAGKEAGYLDAHGYVCIHIGRKMYKAHRLAWLYVYGRWPSKFIDHINSDRKLNAISNLREATKAENCRNSKIRTDNLSGFKGVHLCQSNMKYVAQIRVNGISKHLGYYKSPEEAFAVYCEAAKTYHGRFARLA